MSDYTCLVSSMPTNLTILFFKQVLDNYMIITWIKNRHIVKTMPHFLIQNILLTQTSFHTKALSWVNDCCRIESTYKTSAGCCVVHSYSDSGDITLLNNIKGIESLSLTKSMDGYIKIICIYLVRISRWFEILHHWIKEFHFVRIIRTHRWDTGTLNSQQK